MKEKNKRNKKGKHPVNQEMLFDADNYKLIGLGIILIIVGFTAMYLDKNVFGFVTMYISPIVILGGFAEIIYAIMKPSKSHDNTNSSKLTAN